MPSGGGGGYDMYERPEREEHSQVTGFVAVFLRDGSYKTLKVDESTPTCGALIDALHAKSNCDRDVEDFGLALTFSDGRSIFPDNCTAGGGAAAAAHPPGSIISLTHQPPVNRSPRPPTRCCRRGSSGSR